MLTFRRDNSFVEVAADRVVLALSFSILRRSVDLSRSGLSQLKLTAIHHLRMGTNSKLHLQFDQRRWSELGYTDDTYSDTGYQNTWEVSRAQTGASGIPVGYTGGRIDAGMIEAQCRSARDCFSCKSNRFCPGLSATYNGKAALEYWTGYPWTRELLFLLEGWAIHHLCGD